MQHAAKDSCASWLADPWWRQNRTTVWKDMVEHERRELSATVADGDGGRAKSLLQRARRPLAIALSLAAFATLLGALLAVCSPPLFSSVSVICSLAAD